jgi:hypothetical protein
MNIYKSILDTIVQPLYDVDGRALDEWATWLKESNVLPEQKRDSARAVGEMLERALRYTRMTTALVEEGAFNDVVVQALSEPDCPCPLCGGDVGHRINCPRGIAFSHT